MYVPSSDSARGRRLGAMGSCLFFFSSLCGDMKSWNPGARSMPGDPAGSSASLERESALCRADTSLRIWCFLINSMFRLCRSALSFLKDSHRSSRRSTGGDGVKGHTKLIQHSAHTESDITSDSDIFMVKWTLKP